MIDSETTVLTGESGEVGIVEPKDFVSREPFTFESGETIPEFTIRYETYGRPNADRTNGIIICHALSGDHHCAGVHSIHDRKPGWWNHFIGPGKAIDTNRYFVIGTNSIGGCRGSSGPSSINPATGERYNMAFPHLTIRDMVRTQRRLVDSLELNGLFAAVGGSMGGMQVLQWGVEYPGFVRNIVPMATAGRHRSQAIAFNEVGRSAVIKDPDWKNGAYAEGEGPHVGLAIARMMAHITYLSDKGMESRFGRERKDGWTPGDLVNPEFEVESYLHYQGKSFINRFDANTYIYFTKALDRYDLHHPETNRMEDTLAVLQSRALVVGFTSDWLYPAEQNRDIVHALLRCGKDATYAELDMEHGHDSFLVHSPELYDLVRAFLDADR